MRNRRGLWVIAAVAVIIIAGIIWWTQKGKQTMKEAAQNMAPRIHVTSLNITEIDENSIKLVSETKLENPMPMDLNIDSLYYELWIDSTNVLKTRYPKNILIRKSDSATLELPLELKIDNMKEVIEKFDKENRDSANYTLKADFRMKVPVAGKRNFDLDVTKRLPAIRGVKIKPGKLDIDHLGLKDSEIDMTLHIENRNSFEIKLKDGQYRVTIDKDMELEGAMEKIMVIPPKSSETITMNMKFKTAKVPKLGWKMLFRKKQTHFTMDFSAKIMSDLEMLKDSKTAMHAEGTISDIMEMMEK